MIHGIEIKSTKSTGNKNSTAHTTELRYYRWENSAYVFISKHESRAGEETPIDDTWDSLARSLFGFSAIVYYCDSLISRLVVSFFEQ